MKGNWLHIHDLPQPLPRSRPHTHDEGGWTCSPEGRHGTWVGSTLGVKHGCPCPFQPPMWIRSKEDSSRRSSGCWRLRTMPSPSSAQGSLTATIRPFSRSAALVGTQTLMVPCWLHGMCWNPDGHDFVAVNIWIILAFRKKMTRGQCPCQRVTEMKTYSSEALGEPQAHTLGHSRPVVIPHLPTLRGEDSASHSWLPCGAAQIHLLPHTSVNNLYGNIATLW